MREQLRTGCIDWFREIMEAVPTGWIAGGALRDYFARVESDSDIDVFFPTPEALEKGYKSIEAKGAKKLYDREHVAGFMLNRRHVQMIKKHFFASPAHTIAQFDFTVCCVALSQAGEVLHHPHFFEDLAGKRLAINAIPFPLSTLERLQKYARKGFVACNGTLLEITRAIQQVDLTNPNVNQLTFYPNGAPRFIRFD